MRITALASTPAPRAPATWAAAARATTTRTPPAAATRARCLRVRDLDRAAPAVELAAVELRDRVLGVFGRVHLDEAEAARLPGEPVGDDGGRQDVTALAEELPQAIAGGGVGKTADVELGRHREPPIS